MGTAEDLRAEILARYPSVYAFGKARAGRVTRSVIHQLLAGNYPGNVERQLARAWQALLDKPDKGGLAASDVEDALRLIACRHCAAGKKRCRKMRHECRKLWQEQAAEILKLDAQKAGARQCG